MLRTRLPKGRASYTWGHATTQEGRAFEEACGCKGGKGCEGGEPGDSREIASVCLLLRHFIHVTDNFCHLFCPFSQVVPWSSPAAPDFLSLLSSSVRSCGFASDGFASDSSEDWAGNAGLVEAPAVGVCELLFLRGSGAGSWGSLRANAAVGHRADA